MTATFGKLRGSTLELQDGLNILQAPNETGKSTWCAFLLAILYGINSRERDRTGTNEPVPGLTGTGCGESLLGISREVFERSAFIRQNGLSISQDAELERRIAALISSGEEGTSYTEAAEALKKQLSRRRHNRTGQLPALEAELADNQQKEEAQYDLFCRQVRDEEERGTASFWSVIFKATSFSDLLGRIDFINEVAEHDQSVINDLRQLRQQMQADRQALEEQRSQLESRQTELNSQLEAATQLIAKYNETADGLNDLAAQEKAAADELDAQIQARREEENRNNGGDSGSGGSGSGGGSSGSDETPSSDGYIWPSDCRLITSGYGGREQPTPGASTTHMGVDIGASYGSYIYAVKSGTVTGSKYSWGGYGNYVEIDHGNGNFTLYAHMSERLVEVGEHVEQGEVIGLCGSTGISTGPHVHYEIWENYTRINPLNRLPGYIPYWW